MNPYYYALISTSLWVIASQIYAHLGKKMPIRKLNFWKTLIGLACFTITCLISTGFQINSESLMWLIFSGLLGYGLGDMFLLFSYSQIGPARTMLLQSFTPSFVALFSWLFFQRTIPANKIPGLFLMVLCIYFLTLEKKSRKIEVHPSAVLSAILGVICDAIGIVFTKQAFTIDASINPITANFYRLSVCLPLLFLLYWKPNFMNVKNVVPISHKINRPEILKIFIGATIGTFVALYFYLKAISLANATIVVSITIVSPLIASIYEHIVEKSLPKKSFVAAIVIMITGLYILVK